MPSPNGLVLDREPNVVRVAGTDGYVARFPELGLTSYGSTAEQATNRLRMMFSQLASRRHEQGTLSEWLDKSGLQWHWIEE